MARFLRSCEESVRECALFLDRVRPGWERVVEPEALNFASHTRCVVGQIWGYSYASPHWSTIANKWPSSVVGGKEFWTAEVEARLAPTTFPEKWTEAPVVVR